MMGLMTLLLASNLNAQVPYVSEAWHLQQLVNQSQQQLDALIEILKTSNQNALSLEKASKILEELSTGIGESIKKYQGTELYEKALIELQSKDDFARTFSDSQRTRRHSKELPEIEKQVEQEFQQSVEFQKQSVLANEKDLKLQDELQSVLETAPPGFVPKIQAQAQLGAWRANTRVSTQLTEVLAAVQAMREELRIYRLRNQQQRTLRDLAIGMEIQNRKQLKDRNNGK